MFDQNNYSIPDNLDKYMSVCMYYVCFFLEVPEQGMDTCYRRHSVSVPIRTVRSTFISISMNLVVNECGTGNKYQFSPIDNNTTRNINEIESIRNTSKLLKGKPRMFGIGEDTKKNHKHIIIRPKLPHELGLVDSFHFNS